MEIVIKTKQRFNPSFSFLHHEDRLFPYYKHLLHAINNGSYEPQASQLESNPDPGEGSENKNEKGPSDDDSGLNSKSENSNKLGVGVKPVAYSESETDSEEEEGFELHPILRANLNPIKQDRTKEGNSSNSTSKSNIASTCLEQDLSVSQNQKFKSRTFKSIAYTVNAAPDITEDMLLNGDSSSVSANE